MARSERSCPVLSPASHLAGDSAGWGVGAVSDAPPSGGAPPQPNKNGYWRKIKPVLGQFMYKNGWEWVDLTDED